MGGMTTQLSNFPTRVQENFENDYSGGGFRGPNFQCLRFSYLFISIFIYF